MSLLARCNELSREAQIRLLEAEAPELTVWKPGATLAGPSWFLAPASWSRYDFNAFEDFLAGNFHESMFDARALLGFRVAHDLGRAAVPGGLLCAILLRFSRARS